MLQYTLERYSLVIYCLSLHRVKVTINILNLNQRLWVTTFHVTTSCCWQPSFAFLSTSLLIVIQAPSVDTPFAHSLYRFHPESSAPHVVNPVLSLTINRLDSRNLYCVVKSTLHCNRNPGYDNYCFLLILTILAVTWQFQHRFILATFSFLHLLMFLELQQVSHKNAGMHSLPFVDAALTNEAYVVAN